MIAGGCAGLCYSALWYFPVLITIGGLTALLWDQVLSRAIGKVQARLQRRRSNARRSGSRELTSTVSVGLHRMSSVDNQAHRRVVGRLTDPALSIHSGVERAVSVSIEIVATNQLNTTTLRTGILLILLFLGEQVDGLILKR